MPPRRGADGLRIGLLRVPLSAGGTHSTLSSRPVLSSPQACDCLVGVQEPEQAQEADEDNLAEDRVAVDKEGDYSANNGSFDQVKNSHETALTFRPGIGRLCTCLPDKAAAVPSTASIIR